MNLRFPGQYYDSETGLNYNQSRDYKPITGRYIEGDSFGLQGGVNIYSYSNQSPIVYFDREGNIAAIGAAACFIPGVGWISCAVVGATLVVITVIYVGYKCYATGLCQQTAQSISDCFRRKQPRDCYEECKHLLPSPSGDLQSSEYRKCYRECKGTL
jgi:RHS repeat-associated protein